MKLKQVVIDMTDLTLTKERKKIKYGELFKIADESRANEILKARYKDKPVAIIYNSEQKNTSPQEDASKDNQKSNSKKDNDNLNNKNNGTDEEKDNENLKNKNSQEGNGTQK